nr:Ig-like domain repeat protein [Nocardioides luti]
MQRTATTADRYGRTVTYTQRYRGVPVFGSELKVNVDRVGRLTSVSGFAVPDITVSTTPAFTAAQARAHAVAAVRADPPTGHRGRPARVRGLHASSSALVVYRIGAVRAQVGESVLAYRVEVRAGTTVRDVVIVDARTGKPVNRWSEITDALDRHLQEAAGSSNPATFTEVWKEGDAYPGSLTTDQRNEVEGTGDAYWFFKDTFGRDSYDGAGHSMTTVNNDGRIACPNANWNGTTTNYCNGVSSDDVVAHEWAHAYTEYTSGLIYQWQSGAMNEAYSDIWGETVDLINGRMDEGEGDITAPRPDGACAAQSPGVPALKVQTPYTQDCPAGTASFGPRVPSQGALSQVVQGFTASGSTLGCDTITTALTGKIALLDRGGCPFVTKVKNAQIAGATGVVIGDNVAGPISNMGGADSSITIPSVKIRLSDRNQIVTALASGPVSARLEDTVPRTASTRWLASEKSTSYGGPIRDMWTPTCYGDPGKVSDAQYKCGPATSDSGGVHSNSGVVNHTYALLVDGGSYNGQTVTGLGLDKAANIFFRAQTNYLTPTSDFADLADALQSSCTDLVGQPINKVRLVPGGSAVAADPISSADCDSVAAVTAATELRLPPTQCNFTAVLAPGSPSACGAGTYTRTDWSEDFADGLEGWTTSSQVVDGQHTPWVATTRLPRGRTGSAAYAANPDSSVCTPGPSGHASRESLTSPVLTVPAGQSPRVVLDHYIATEPGYDGGNIKVSVNGGPFTVVPPAAYVQNAPSTTLTPAAGGNNNPMASERAWSGVDAGSNAGSWGTSQIDLASLAAAGDHVQLRFDLGQDVCSGRVGWYLDNVKIVHCESLRGVDLAVEPTGPTTYGANRSLAVTATSATTPTGTVTVSEGSTTLGTVDLVDGAANVPLPTDLEVGTHDLTVDYSGDADHDATQKTRTIAVERASSTLGVVHSPEPAALDSAHEVQVVATGGGVPSGTVTVSEGSTVLGTADLSNGHASVPLPTDLGVGTHTLVVDYPGDAHNLASSEQVVATIGRRVSTTTATLAQDPTAYGAPAHLGVQVAGHGTPAGLVTVSENGTVLGTADLVGGAADLVLPATLEPGSHQLVVAYQGDDTNDPSSTGVLATVRRADSTTSAGHTPDPVVLGGDHAVQVLVSGASPTGVVSVSEGEGVLGTATLTDGHATVALPPEMAVGTHTLRVTYAGDAHNAGSTSDVTAYVAKVVSTTTATLSGTSTYGTPAHVTLTVTGHGTPTGTVSVAEGQTVLATGSLVGGEADLSLPADLEPGQHQLVLAYAGDADNDPSSTTRLLTVDRAGSTTTATHAPEPATFGSAHDLQVLVSGVGDPVGSVTVSEGDTVLGTSAIDGGHATIALSPSMTVGGHQLVVSYPGDAHHTGSTVTVNATVARAASTTKAVPKSDRVRVGKPVKATVTVSAPGLVPSGTVRVVEGKRTVATGVLSAGRVVVSVTRKLGPGKHTFTVTYPGSTTVAPSRTTFIVRVVKRKG